MPGSSSLLNEPVGIALSNALTYQQVLKLKDMLTDDNRYLNQELLRMSGDEIIGTDFGLKDVMEMVRKVCAPGKPRAAPREKREWGRAS